MAGQASQAALDTALKATHQSVKAMTPALEAAQAASRKLGFADEDTRTALSRLEVATGNTKKAITDLSVAQNISRFKHVALSAGSQMLAMAMTGSQRAAKQLGIVVAAVSPHLDALKARHVDLTTVSGKLQEAHAKVLDKMATGQAVIDAVTEKVKGQAAAFAGTAAGGMEQFHAQLQHMEEGLGNKLLPALVKVLNWVNSEWPAISAVFQTVFSAVGRAIDFVRPYFDLFRSKVEEIVARVRADWPQIHKTIETVMLAVKDIISGVVNIAEAIWAKFGSAITSIAKTVFNALGPLIHNALNIVVGIFQTIGDLLHGRWGQVWGDIKKIVSNALQAVARIIETAASVLFQAAVAIGKAIIEGILAGLKSLVVKVGNSIASGLRAAIDNAKHELGIKSPSSVTRDLIGIPLAQGVIEGWRTGIAPFQRMINDNLQSAIVIANKKLDAWIKTVKLPTLLQDATNYANAASTASANAQTISDYQSAIFAGAAGINRSGSPGDRDFAAGIPGYASGGVVPGVGPRLAVVHGGETITPPGRGGGNVFHINVNGWVGNDQDIAARISRELQRFGHRNPTIFTVAAS